MMFLFDDEHGQSQLKDLAGWSVAEQYAEDKGWNLIGEFLHYVDEDGEKVTTVQ